MITPRKALLQKLKTIMPAVADHDLIPIHTHFIFTGTHLLAYNEQIALSVPKPSDFRAALPARMLVDLLQASHAPAAELRSVGDHAELKLGDAIFKLPMLPSEEFSNLFQTPPMPRQTMQVTAQFLDGIQHCLQSGSDYATVPEQLGVTLIADGYEVKLFSTDVTTMAFAQLKLPQKCVVLHQWRPRKRIILWREFCEQMLKLAAQAQTTRLVLHRDYALFAADDVMLYGRLLKSAEPLDFKAALQYHLPQDFAARAIPMPPQLAPLLKRVARLSDIKGNESPTKISIKDGIATFHTQSDRGVLDDTLALPGHPDVQLSVNAALLLRGCAACGRISVH